MTSPMTESANPVWRELSAPREVASALVDLYRRRGGDRYEEVVTQTDHALQCGSLALASRATDALAAAAFLHDVGHLLLPEESSEIDRRHEQIGSRFLANWFGEEVLAPVRLHVPAKRYLCAVEPTYHAGLSAASVRSLELQGGPMTPDETAAFEALDHSEAAVDLRRWDDQAKALGAPTATLDAFEQLLGDVLWRR